MMERIRQALKNPSLRARLLMALAALAACACVSALDASCLAASTCACVGAVRGSTALAGWCVLPHTGQGLPSVSA